MTMPAELTSANDWDRLIAELRTEYREIDDLYQRITAPEEDDNEPDTTEEAEPVSDLDAEYDAEDHDRAAELEEAERVRLDAETDGDLDGDYDPEPDDDPGLEA